MSIEGQGHFFTIYFPGFVCFVLYKATISGERLQDHWSSGSTSEKKMRQLFSLFLRGVAFLAHLSQRLIGELIGYPWSGVSHPSLSFSSVHNFKRLLL